jgi:NADPH-dependent 2,4-dienoyl-CoA reductase/sulfur reductase-like enzyme
MTHVIVVGAGVAGLTAAHTLSEGTQVTLVDRLPACGGVLQFDHRTIRELERKATRGGVDFALGTTATRWTQNRLLLAAPHAIRWVVADHLVYAGGSRPSTAAELRLTGLARLAGILPAPVAAHLLEAGVRIGSRPVVIGSGDWADRVIAELAHNRIRPTRVIPPDEAFSADGARDAEIYADWTPVTAAGSGRVDQLFIESRGARRRLLCDAVVLAAGLRPLRNIDGAIDEDASTTYIQHIAQHTTTEEVASHAANASQAVIELLGSR